ncbi:MAG: glycosyltransferase family 39 protein, partial [Terracidiphilus sp.]
MYLLPFMRILQLGGDEGTIVYGAVRIVHGQVFARDFFEVMGPGSFYWLAAFYKLFGVTFLAARISLFLASLGTGLLMYFLSRRILERYRILPCLILASTYFGPVWPGSSHHVDSNFLALLSVACVVLWKDRKKNILLLAAGVLAGISTFFLQPKGLLLLLAILLWLWVQHRRRVAPIAALCLVAVGFLGAATLALAYFWSQGALSSLVYANVVWPFHHYERVNAVPYAQGIIPWYLEPWLAGNGGLNWRVGIVAILVQPFIFVAALPIFLLILGFRRGWKIATPEILLYSLCGCALWTSELHRK